MSLELTKTKNNNGTYTVTVMSDGHEAIVSASMMLIDWDVPYVLIPGGVTAANIDSADKARFVFEGLDLVISIEKLKKLKAQLG